MKINRHTVVIMLTRSFGTINARDPMPKRTFCKTVFFFFFLVFFIRVQRRNIEKNISFFYWKCKPCAGKNDIIPGCVVDFYKRGTRRININLKISRVSKSKLSRRDHVVILFFFFFSLP